MSTHIEPEQKRICVSVVTTARADYGLLRWIIRDFSEDPAFDLDLVVTGSHYSERHGKTVNEILADGFERVFHIPVEIQRDEPNSYSAAISEISTNLTLHLTARRPDIVVVLGDRWELLAVANACVVTATPLAHFSGGEVTEGALDDSVRHAVTKLSHIHFVANEVYAARVRQLGEENWRISVCGSPGIDNFTRLHLLGKRELSEKIGMDLSMPTAIVAFHPATRSDIQIGDQIDFFISALTRARKEVGLQFVITAPNADPGADRIEAALRTFADSSSDAVYVPSLGSQLFLSLLKIAQLMIGNSSSAFHEAPVAGLVCVNVGDRQKGRISGGNVISVGYTTDEIWTGIVKALKFNRTTRFQSPYGSGSASTLVRAFLTDVFSSHDRMAILRKKFVDLPSVGC
jgi:GDP/UDP-N,N'-diacetylbacillosamine 2-epimerase (hydrolysing)